MSSQLHRIGKMERPAGRQRGPAIKVTAEIQKEFKDRDVAEPGVPGPLPGETRFSDRATTIRSSHTSFFGGVAAQLEARRTREPGKRYTID